MKRIIDISGKRFGKLTAIRYLGPKICPQLQSAWLCKCDCGKEKAISGGRLRFGDTTTCGCGPQGNFLHGEGSKGKESAEYRCLHHVIQRCENPNNIGYADYGGRGIKCLWKRSDYSAFLAHVGRKPTPKHTLERINTNGNYEPGNVRWATHAEQHRNKRNNVWIECDGEKMCVVDAAKKYGIKWGMLYSRLKTGWPIEAALKTPPTHGFRGNIYRKNVPKPYEVSK